MSIWLRSLWRGFPFLRASHVRTMRRCRWVRATPLSISTSFNAHFRYPQLPSRPRLNTGVVLQLSGYWSFYGWSLPSGLCQARDGVIIRNSRSKQSLQSPYTSSRSHSRPILRTTATDHHSSPHSARKGLPCCHHRFSPSSSLERCMTW